MCMDDDTKPDQIEAEAEYLAKRLNAILAEYEGFDTKVVIEALIQVIDKHDIQDEIMEGLDIGI